MAIDPIVATSVTAALGSLLRSGGAVAAFRGWLRQHKDLAVSPGTFGDATRPTRTADAESALVHAVSEIAGDDPDVQRMLEQAVRNTPNALQATTVAEVLAAQSDSLGDDAAGAGAAQQAPLERASRELAEIDIDDELVDVYGLSIRAFFPWAPSEAVRTAALWSALRYDAIAKGFRTDRVELEDLQFLRGVLHVSVPNLARLHA